MNVPRRQFTEEQIYFMRRQSLGEISMHQLERMTKSSRETLIPFMVGLGLQPHIQRTRRGMRVDNRYHMADAVNAAPTVHRQGKDELLERLMQRHGDRRYG